MAKADQRRLDVILARRAPDRAPLSSDATGSPTHDESRNR
jgi:hypothetical protein